MFVRSTTEGDDAHGSTPTWKLTRATQTEPPAESGGTPNAVRLVSWLAVDGGRPFVVADTDKSGMPE